MVKDTGDEPLQIFRKFSDILVVVDGNRVRAVKRIMKEYPETGVIILDDGFQHRSIKPGLSILLLDFNRPVTKDHLLPFGNLREGKQNLRRADVILITKSPGNISPISQRMIMKDINKAPYQEIWFTSFLYKDPLPVFPGNSSAILSLKSLDPGKCGIVLVTGIADPEPLKDYLGNFSTEIVHMDFPDHYCFSEKDIGKIGNAYDALRSSLKFVLTTEKDAVRLVEFTNMAKSLKKAFYYIPVEVNFLNEGRHGFDKLITDYVRKNRRNNRLSEVKRIY